MKRILTAALFLGVSQTSLAGVYDLTFRRVAASDDAETCRVFAESTAASFASNSGVTIIDHGCRLDGFSVQGFDAVITYQASLPVEITSTRSFGMNSAAFYETRAECNERLLVQKELFANATGLAPFAAYCMLDLAYDSRWETRIDAVGKSEVTPGIASLTIWGAIAEGQSVFANYRSAAESFGIDIYEAGIARRPVGREVVLRFFATDAYMLDNYNDMKFGSLDGCKEGTVEVNSMLAAASKPVVVFCTLEREDGPATLHATYFRKTFEPVRIFDARVLTTQYADLTACRQAASRVDTSSGDVFGALCAGTDENFRVHLFSRP